VEVNPGIRSHRCAVDTQTKSETAKAWRLKRKDKAALSERGSTDYHHRNMVALVTVINHNKILQAHCEEYQYVTVYHEIYNDIRNPHY
jgi:hypothetical protein